MGKPRRRFVGKPDKGKWRVWDNKRSKWWGLFFDYYPETLIEELNSYKRPDEIHKLSKNMKKGP